LDDACDVGRLLTKFYGFGLSPIEFFCTAVLSDCLLIWIRNVRIMTTGKKMEYVCEIC
jgi:hypothetical protein